MTKQFSGAGLHRNLTSYLGLIVTAGSAALILATLLWSFALKTPSPYIGIFSYMIFPGFLMFGLTVFFSGMWRESRRRRRLGTTEALPYPRMDLNIPRHRRKFMVVMIGGTLLAILLGFVGYNAFLFTESITFCGRICHTVMEPEYKAYLKSPHARVRCVDCHVGHGVDWYVKSKLSGMYQVYAVLFQTYEKPIPVPVKNLRPARETCEECHWPNKFYGAQLIQIPYFRTDEQNTNDQISFMVKTGGGSALLGQSAGIHWHMIINEKIIFAARDEQQLDIPWIKVVGAHGDERVYMDQELPLKPGELEDLKRHTMDCMDCHNRPTHVFTPPDRAIDLAMNNGSVSRDIPWIKKITAETLMEPYPDNATAVKQIRDRIFNFYATRYPDIYRKRSEDIQRAVAVATDFYERSIFPKMNVSWGTYPDHIGHRNWPGCFRCHDGKHATADGKVLSQECTICHTMPQRGPLEALGALPPITDTSWHPFSLKGKHGKILCNRCHSPGIRPSADCGNCHKMPQGNAMAGMDCTDCHPAAPERLPVAECKGCHEKPAGLHKKGGHADAECKDCHKPHEWKASGRDMCLGCHDDRKTHNAPRACPECHAFKASA